MFEREKGKTLAWGKRLVPSAKPRDVALKLQFPFLWAESLG